MTDPRVPDLRREALPLRGRNAVVTGASRRGGIGHAIACRLAAYGASVLVHHHLPHDEQQAWGADDLHSVVTDVRRHLSDDDASVVDQAADLEGPSAPQRLIDTAVAQLGHVDVLVCNHARNGGDGALGDLDATMLDGHWAVNTRSAILLAQAYAHHHDDRRPGGRIIFMTSGQHLGPLPGEIAYGAAKAALAGITLTVADQLADRGITLNTINPGPVATGHLTDEMWREVAPKFPLGRYGQPDDPARLIAWLAPTRPNGSPARSSTPRAALDAGATAPPDGR